VILRNSRYDSWDSRNLSWTEVARLCPNNLLMKVVSSMAVIERESLLLTIVLQFHITDGPGGPLRVDDGRDDEKRMTT
jgi:hypothetical protein